MYDKVESDETKFETSELNTVLDTNTNTNSTSTLTTENNDHTKPAELIDELKAKLDDENNRAKQAEHKRLLQHLAAKLWISHIQSIEELVTSQKFITIAHQLLDTQWWEAIQQEEKKWLYSIKTAIYAHFMSDPSTKPKVLMFDNLPVIDDTYFAFDPHVDTEKVFALQGQFPKVEINHHIPLHIQHAALQAIQRYPELKDKKIAIDIVNGFTLQPSKQHVMRSQFNIPLLLWELIGLVEHTNRRYVIWINTIHEEGVMTLQKLQKQWSRWGVKVHEFGHILDYSKKSAWEMIKFVLAFWLSAKRVQELERKIDETTVARGAWYELYTFRQEVLTGSREEYVDYKKINYLWPKEILYAILKHHTSYNQDTLMKVMDHIIHDEY